MLVRSGMLRVARLRVPSHIPLRPTILPYRAMSYTIPLDSWDTHCHIFDPVRHPYVSDTPYSPPARSIGHLIQTSKVKHHVIVMSRPEGTNTAHTVEAIESLNSMGRQGRGTVVLDQGQMSEGNLRMLNTQGIRSVRIHLHGLDGRTLQEVVREAAEKIQPVGWSLDLHLDLDTWANIVPTLRKLHQTHGTFFVADHLFSSGPTPIDDARLAAILSLVDDGVLYVKISGCERFAGKEKDGIQSQAGLIRRILRAHNGERSLFGSDWPYVRMGPDGGLGEVDVGKQLEMIWECCDGDQGLWENVMSRNAARLYA